MARKERIIWNSRDRFNYDDPEWKELTDEMLGEGASDDQRFDYVSATVFEYLNDERANLNIDTEGTIVAIADLGLWNGRTGYRAYKEVGSNIRNIFDYDTDEAKFYSDGYNVRSEQSHHDGTNSILFREMRPERDMGRFFGIVYNGRLTKSKLKYYTRSILPYVANAYGW